MALRKIVLCLFFAALALAGTASTALAGNGRFTGIGPGGGPALAIRTDPRRPQIVYAAAGAGGIYKSLNGGGSWQRLPGVPAPWVVLDLAVDPVVPSTLYAAAGDTVLRSRNGGTTFTNVGAAIGGFRVTQVVLDPRNSLTVYAAAISGLWKSVNGGASWSQASRQLANREVSALAFDPRAPRTLFATVRTDNGRRLYKSTDGGAAWKASDNGLHLDYYQREAEYEIAFDPLVAKRLFATAVPRGLIGYGPANYRSTNGGATWQVLSDAYEYPLVAGRGFLLAGKLRSTDGGDTWRQNGVPVAPIASFSFDPRSDRVVYAGSESRGMAKSTDGGQTWKDVSRGFWATAVTGLAVDPRTSPTLLAAVNGARLWSKALAPAGIFLLQYASSSPADIGGISDLTPDPNNPGFLYADYDTRPARSTDGGRSFRGLPAGDRCWSLTGMALDPSTSQDVYVVGQGRVVPGFPPDPYCPTTCRALRSTNGGATFSCMDIAGFSSFADVEAHPGRPGTVFASIGGDVRALSTDRGETWEVLESSGLKSLAFDPHQADLVYGATSVGVLRSTDGGRSFTLWSRNLDRPVSGLIVDPLAPSILYATTTDGGNEGNSGIYRSRDGGQTWSPIPGLPAVLHTGVFAFDAARNTIYAGTNGQGIFAATVPR